MSTAPPEIDTDFTVLEDLDFAMVCELPRTTEDQVVMPQRCQETAVWVAHLRRHGCKAPAIGQYVLVICQKHHDFIINGGKGLCQTCSEVEAFKNYVIRFEPLEKS